MNNHNFLLCNHCANVVNYDEWTGDNNQCNATKKGLDIVHESGYLSYSSPVETFTQCDICGLDDGAHYFALWVLAA